MQSADSGQYVFIGENQWLTGDSAHKMILASTHDDVANAICERALSCTQIIGDFEKECGETRLQQCLQFLVLRARTNDIEGKLLAPSASVRETWNVLMSQPKNYAMLCTTMCGSVLDRMPDGPTRQQREEATRHFHASIFGVSPIANFVTITLLDDCSSKDFQVCDTTTIIQLATSYATFSGADVSDVQFRYGDHFLFRMDEGFDNTIFSSNATLIQAGVVNGGRIIATVVNHNPITDGQRWEDDVGADAFLA